MHVLLYLDLKSYEEQLTKVDNLVSVDGLSSSGMLCFAWKMDCQSLLLSVSEQLCKSTVLVKSFAHLISWISCDPPERGGLILNMVVYETSNS